MVRVCYNCQRENPGHRAKYCPSPQKYTRCHPCDRVCTASVDHYAICPNQTFISQYIEQPGTARSATLVADFKITTGASVFVMDGPRPMDVSTEFPPIQVDANYGLLLGSKKTYKYYQWFPADNRRCVVNVADGSGLVRLSAQLMDDKLIINRKIRVRNSGVVEFRQGQPINEIGQAEVTLKVDTVTPFKISFYAFQKCFCFEITQAGVRYLPPEWLPVECPICYNMVNTEVRMTTCMHMFCTVCILRTLAEGNDHCPCPVCRTPLTERNLRSIYLYSN